MFFSSIEYKILSPIIKNFGQQQWTLQYCLKKQLPAPKNISTNINQIILSTITESRFILGNIGAFSGINGSIEGIGGIGRLGGIMAVIAAMEDSAAFTVALGDLRTLE